MTTFYLFIRSKIIFVVLSIVYYLFILPFIILAILFMRVFVKKKIDIGLGPEPMINNIYHKKALELYGYSAETFVDTVYFITSEFDYRGDLQWYNRLKYIRSFSSIFLFLRMVGRYRCVYLYFNGGPLSGDRFLKALEPKLLKLGNTKILVMPYGGDVNDMSIARNFIFKHAIDQDYPQFFLRNRKVKDQIVRWTTYSDKVISGCDWVDYMYHWDKLTLAHFSFDKNKTVGFKDPDYVLPQRFSAERPLRILHAPNHKHMKGTIFIEEAVKELKEEGYPVELTMIQKQPNHVILEAIAKTDIVADQLVIGWYAMFALEGLSLSKPVICFLRDDLIELYRFARLITSEDELPFLNCNVFNIKQRLKDVLDCEIDLKSLADKCLPYLENHHSLEHVGGIFNELNRDMGIYPVNKKI